MEEKWVQQGVTLRELLYLGYGFRQILYDCSRLTFGLISLRVAVEEASMLNVCVKKRNKIGDLSII